MPPDVDTITTLATSVTATALAVTAFALAYIAKTIREWWTWRK